MWARVVISVAAFSLLRAQLRTGNESEQEAKLARKVNIDKEMSASLGKVLEALSDRFDVTFVIDCKAFERAGHKDVLKAQVKVPVRKNVELRQVLLEMLKPFQ